MKERGKLIVLEGIDGCGKTKQLELLLAKFEEEGFLARPADFPQYEQFFGQLVGRFLKGEFGLLDEVDPYLAAVLFAADRWQAKEELEYFLSQGVIVVCNRYATSNIAHQGARMPEKEREKFLAWLEEMEYQVFGIPREDLVIFLEVPVEIAQSLLEKKTDRSYLDGKRVDIQEANRRHLEEARKMYLLLADRNDNWIQIDCCDENGNLLTPQQIHELVWLTVKDKI